MIRFPPKKILVPYDMSEVSILAWKHAVALARRFSSSLEIVYVEEWIPPTDLMLLPPPLTPARRKEIVTSIRRQVGARAKIVVLEGDPSVNILRVAHTRAPDLIVMGSRGRTGLKRAWNGSVAEVVTRNSPVPVYIARGPVHRVRSVLAPVNFTDYSDYGFMFAAGVAASLKARLTALHVTADPARCGNPRFRLSAVVERLPQQVLKACRPQIETVSGAVPEAILASAQDKGLVVITAHKKSLVRDALLGTTAERVLRKSTVPVLAVPAPKRLFTTGQWSLGSAHETAR